MALAPALTLRTALASAVRRLAAAGVDSPALDARILIRHALGLSREAMLAGPDRPLTPAEADAVDTLIARRAGREPVSRILGRREFWSLDFDLSPATLDPRPDTETVVEAALAEVADRGAVLDVLDLGTGSGCILLALLSELPNAAGLGIDADPQAVATAAANADRLGFASRAEFRCGDWTAGLTRSFDLVVANPPYIAEDDIAALQPEVSRFDPRAALAGGADGLDAYRALACQVPRVLKPDGVAAFELGAGQADAVARLMRAAGLTVRRLAADLSGTPRCLVVHNLG